MIFKKKNIHIKFVPLRKLRRCSCQEYFSSWILSSFSQIKLHTQISLSVCVLSPPCSRRKLGGRSRLLEVCSLLAQTVYGHFRPRFTQMKFHKKNRSDHSGTNCSWKFQTIFYQEKNYLSYWEVLCLNHVL